MQAFVPFAKNDSVRALAITLDAWEEAGFTPIVLQVTDSPKRYRTFRVAAENIAEGEHYIIADLGCVPVPAGKKFATTLEPKLESIEGIAGLAHKRNAATIPTGVRIVRKGVVDKWPQKRTETYDAEHAEAVKLAGKKVVMLPDVFYKNVLEV